MARLFERSEADEPNIFLTECLYLTPDVPAICGQEPVCLVRSFRGSVLVKQLIEAGVHFGHRASRWNPKMRPYIYARQNLIHIIDVRETIRGLLRAKKYLDAGRQRRQPGAVRRHQAAGGRDDRARSRYAAACRSSATAGWAAR